MAFKVETHRSQPTTSFSSQDYDRHQRDRDAKRFYSSARWQKVRTLQLMRTPQCERCWAKDDLVAATHVHHKIELRDDWSLAVDFDNLQSLCASCHSRIHIGKHTGGQGLESADA